MFHAAKVSILTTSARQRVSEAVQQGLLDFSNVMSALLQIIGVGRFELRAIEIELSLNRFLGRTTFLFDGMKEPVLEGFVGQHQSMGSEDLSIFVPQPGLCVRGQGIQLPSQRDQGLAETMGFTQRIDPMGPSGEGGMPLIKAGTPQSDAWRERNALKPSLGSRATHVGIHP
jgi:hypothetical protein